MPVTSLKTGTDPEPSLNDMIDPVWIPTFPAKLRFAAVAAVPTTLILSVRENQVVHDHIALYQH